MQLYKEFLHTSKRLIELKKRIIVPIVGQGSIIHIIRTGMLEKMRSFCEPVVIMLWHQEDLAEELKNMGVEVHIMPPYQVSNTYKSLRLKINYWYLYFRLKTPGTVIQKKYASKFRPAKNVLKKKVKETLLWLRLKTNPNYIHSLIRQENDLLLIESTYRSYYNFVTQLNANGIFTVTPFLHEVELVARILKTQGGCLVASIHSFDNVTKRGWPAIFFDRYFVWNKYNKAELERINTGFKKQDVITIAGAPQFDFHYKKDFCWTREVWLQKLGLPANKKIILYAGGSANLYPNEPQYLQDIVKAFESGQIKADAIILFRCHPLDAIERWQNWVGPSPYVFYDHKAPSKLKLDYNNFTVEDEQRLISTLKHTDIHINLCSTMAVDGSIFNKPQIAPYYDDANKSAEEWLRAYYRQEHYVPIVNSKVLNMAFDKEALADYINKALQNPSAYNTHCIDCVKEIATFNDGKSTDRVIAKLTELIA